MDARLPTEDPGSPLIALDAQPRALRLPAGAALFALRGEVWLTQEGRREDVILAAGQRYDVGAQAPIVVSATRGRAELYVVQPVDARAVKLADLHDFLRANAQRLRREEIDHLLGCSTQWLRSLAARWLARRPARPAADACGRTTARA